MTERKTTTSPEPKLPARRPWVAPTLEELPRLTELTLQSPEGGSIPGSGDTGGGSVF